MRSSGGSEPIEIFNSVERPAKRRRSHPINQAQGSSSAQTSHDGRRNRSHQSCAECIRRKQRCDRKEPCSQCVSRSVPHLCKPIANGMEVDEDMAEMKTRLANMETLLNRMFSLMSTTRSPPDLLSLGQTIDPSNMGYSVPSFGAQPNQSAVTPVRYGWGVKEMRMIHLDGGSNSGELKDILRILEQSGVSKADLEKLMASIPGRRITEELVDFYFKEIDWTMYKIHEPGFKSQCHNLFQSLSSSPVNPPINADLLRWLPLLFIVLTIAVHDAPPAIIAEKEQEAWLQRFYVASRISIDYAKALQRDNLDYLLASLLGSRFMLMTRRPAEGGIPLTIAFRVGLHRDGTVLHMADKREIELRRRAWAHLYHLDRMISLLLPANLDDEELEGSFDKAGHPFTIPTRWTYVIVRHDLADILGRIANHTFAVIQPSYQTVLDLERNLLAWRDRLPSFLSFTSTDKSYDENHPYLRVQRYLLATEWHYARIALHRPYLLRNSVSDHYVVSQNAAIESAEADLLTRREFSLEQPHVKCSGGYRLMDALMVIGAKIKLDPNSSRSDELRHILDVVTRRQPDDQGRISDPLGQEELSVVEKLASQANPKLTQTATSASNEANLNLESFVSSVNDTASSWNKPTVQSKAPEVMVPDPGSKSSLAETSSATLLSDWARTIDSASSSAGNPTATALHVAGSQAGMNDLLAPPLAVIPTNYLLANMFSPNGPSLPYGQVSADTFDWSHFDIDFNGNTASTENGLNPFELAQNRPVTSTTGVVSQVDEQTRIFNVLLAGMMNQ